MQICQGWPISPILLRRVIYCSPSPSFPFVLLPFLPFSLLYAPFLSPNPIYTPLSNLSVQIAPAAIAVLYFFVFHQNDQIHDHRRAPAAAMAATALAPRGQLASARIKGVELADPHEDAVYPARQGGQESDLVCVRADSVR